MRLFIPTIGTELRLLTDWEFILHCEHRNYSLIDHFKLDPNIRDRWDCYSYRRPGGEDAWKVVLKAGTVLRVDRIYIRKGLDDFDSLSFVVVDSLDKTIGTKQNGCKAAIRFWAKLPDVNNIDCELAEGTCLL